MTVLSNLDQILVRATVRDYTTRSSISDIALGTAVTAQTDQGPADEVELCRCPPGYRGTSCEVSLHVLKLLYQIYFNIQRNRSYAMTCTTKMYMIIRLVFMECVSHVRVKMQNHAK